MGIVVTGNDNYSTLSGDSQTLVDAAIVAIRATYAEAATDGQKENVRVILQEIVTLQEES